MLTPMFCYSRAFGKENLIKEQLAYWCSKAKKGQRILIASIHGNYILKFEGKFTQKPSEIKFRAYYDQ